MSMKLYKAISMVFIALNTAQALAQPVDNKEAIVKENIAQLMQKYHVPGVAVELYVDGKPYAYYFGYANTDKKIPVDENTIFEVGSISKLFTSIVTAKEANAGHLRLDNKVSQYLPDVFKDQSNDTLTLGNLATHTAGFPFMAPDEVKTRFDLANYVGQAKLTHTGNQWTYSNVGVGLLGLALENSTHKTINQLYRHEIIAPLHMQPIGTVVPKQLIANYAQGYDKEGKPAEHWGEGLFPAAWSLKLPAKDAQRFLAAAIGLPGTPASLRQAIKLTEMPYFTVNSMQQGMGWQIHSLAPANIRSLLHDPDDMSFGPFTATQISKDKQVYPREALIDKTGATEGFRAYIAVIPERKTGIVILTNHYISNGAIVNAARKILFEVNAISEE